MKERELLRQTADAAADFLETLDARPVRPETDVEELLAALGGPLPEEGAEPGAVLDALVEDAGPGIVGIPSGRYFGFSRRARGFPIYAAIRSLGRAGIAAMVERCCAHARRFAEALEAGGATVLNEVVLNQVLVRLGDGERTREAIECVQRDGTCWLSGTDWNGEHAMRISVSNWRTTEEDVDRSVAAILAAAGAPA